MAVAVVLSAGSEVATAAPSELNLVQGDRMIIAKMWRFDYTGHIMHGGGRPPGSVNDSWSAAVVAVATFDSQCHRSLERASRSLQLQQAASSPLLVCLQLPPPPLVAVMTPLLTGISGRSLGKVGATSAATRWFG